jgi:hypothetical protein
MKTGVRMNPTARIAADILERISNRKLDRWTTL